MYNVSDLITRDRATYYRGSPSERLSRLPTITLYLGCSFLVSGIIWNPTDNFLTGVLSAQAILVGFSFNVLFYLVSNRLTRPATFTSIEHQKRFERLSLLSSELVDNVSYFNFVAVVSAIVCIILILIDAKSICSWGPTINELLPTKYEFKPKAVAMAVSWFKWVSLWGLSFLLIESYHTFIRSVLRISFYFSLTRTMHEKSEARQNEIDQVPTVCTVDP